MGKRIFAIMMALVMVLALAACGGEGVAVPVQRADQLAVAGQAEERYAAMVVTDNVVEIQRDSSKTIEELYVQLGQAVKAGDKLFSYDSDALELDLEKAQLEVEKMTNEQEDYTKQLGKLEKQLAKTYNNSAKVRLTLEINTLKTTMMQNDYNLAAKNNEIEKLTEMLANVDITTPVDGTIRQIDEQGQSGCYIKVQQTGAYRIQGSINEMSIGRGLMVGSRVIAHSRVSEETWTGTVTSIDTEASQQDQNDMYYPNYGMMDTMTGTSNYVFFVELDSVEGLLLGQHVYVERIPENVAMEGLWIPESYLFDVTVNEETMEMSASVWADSGNGRLQKRTVMLGMLDDMTGCYEILSGITGEDYLADPLNPDCAAGAATSKREAADFDVQIPQQEQNPEEMDGAMLPEEILPEGDIAEDMQTDPEATETVITVEPVVETAGEDMG